MSVYILYVRLLIWLSTFYLLYS